MQDTWRECRSRRIPHFTGLFKSLNNTLLCITIKTAHSLNRYILTYNSEIRECNSRSRRFGSGFTIGKCRNPDLRIYEIQNLSMASKIGLSKNARTWDLLRTSLKTNFRKSKNMWTWEATRECLSSPIFPLIFKDTHPSRNATKMTTYTVSFYFDKSKDAKRSRLPPLRLL